MSLHCWLRTEKVQGWTRTPSPVLASLPVSETELRTFLWLERTLRRRGGSGENRVRAEACELPLTRLRFFEPFTVESHGEKEGPGWPLALAQHRLAISRDGLHFYGYRSRVDGVGYVTEAVGRSFLLERYQECVLAEREPRALSEALMRLLTEDLESAARVVQRLEGEVPLLLPPEAAARLLAHPDPEVRLALLRQLGPAGEGTRDRLR